MGRMVIRRRRARLTVLAAAAMLGPALVLLTTDAATPASPAPAAAPPETPVGFQDTVAIAGLDTPTAVAFAFDGTAFIATKDGRIRAFDYDADTDEFEQVVSSTLVADISENVHNFHDRGLTGIAVDPQLGSPGHNYVYVNYAYNRDPRDNPAIVPKWSAPDTMEADDGCPFWASMDPVETGCVIDIRVSRIPMTYQGVNGWVAEGPEEPLVESACMQFDSHASGDVVIGPDGYLYASAGDGASYDTEDWGQAGNPCGDPPNEGGSLRSQDIRTGADPLSLSGSIFRVNRENGTAANGSTNNADRIVAVGQRNPWRLAFRPGTTELWSGDVGSEYWEEINRTDVAGGVPVNLGWPCYEGAAGAVQKNVGWDAQDKPICENLYAAQATTPGTVKPPYFSYRNRDGGLMTPGENCLEGTSSISGIAFVPSSSDYPAEYKDSLYFNDYARGCIWRLGKLPNGDPNPGSITPFVEAAPVPVGIEIGPGGDLYYVDLGIVDGLPSPGAGAIHRVVYTPANQAPVATLTASAPYGAGLLTVDFDASGSTDADGDPLTYQWSLDGDGLFDDGGGTTRTKVYASAGARTVQVKVSDGNGGNSTKSVFVTPGNDSPTLTSVTPAGSLTWTVGDTIDFAATATDPEQALPDSAFTWSLVIEHCPSVCHSHPITTWTGQRTGSFVAPDHEYPSDLLLKVTVTDAAGAIDSQTVKIFPKSASMSFRSVPTGAALTVAGHGVFAPNTQTFIRGHYFNVVAPATRSFQGVDYEFSSWSDGGAIAHGVTIQNDGTALTARYTCADPAPFCSVKLLTKRDGLKLSVGGKLVKSGWTRTFEPGDTLRLVAPKTQRKNGVLWKFVRWSDGGNRKRTVTVAGAPIKLKAVYKRVR